MLFFSIKISSLNFQDNLFLSWWFLEWNLNEINVGNNLDKKDDYYYLWFLAISLMNLSLKPFQSFSSLIEKKSYKLKVSGACA
jgi:hypothetical protein